MPETIKINRPEIVLKNLQVKSPEILRKLAAALTVIEEECGIHETRITIEGIFVCPWINLSEIQSTEMEKLLVELFTEIKSK